LGRLTDAAFWERVVRRGWISTEQLSEMARAITAWRKSAASVIGLAECMALAWKP
jgi:parallel beta-helix repeat protein